MMCHIIEQLSTTYPVTRLCPVLDVAKSRYYYWRGHRQTSPQQTHLHTHVKAIANEVGTPTGADAWHRRCLIAACVWGGIAHGA